MLAVQYLEPGPHIAAIAPAEARARLRAALECLRIDIVILGWDLPAALVDGCAEETRRAGARLYLWHPLLTGSAARPPRPEWQTIGLDGAPVPGFRGLSEFTFVCPNRPAAAEAAYAQLERALRRGPYDGVFLDRIRFPSPAEDLGRLACFCPGCARAAAAEGFDLAAAQAGLRALLATPAALHGCVRALLAPAAGGEPLLRAFLAFRTRSITRCVQTAAGVARAAGLAVGLDCFAPSLAPMVGQDLAALGATCDWIKVMTYGHALGPAGMPYELLALWGWLVGRGVPESDVRDTLAHATGLEMPASCAFLRERGLAPAVLAAEIRRARAAGVRTVLAGIELVDVPGVTALEPAQITADLRAFRTAQPDGLALSWDLWLIAPERLEIVRAEWPPAPEC